MRWRVRREGQAVPSTALRLARCEASAADKNGSDISQGELGMQFMVYRVRSGKFRGKLVKLAWSKWYRLMIDRVRAIGTWARVMRLREREQARRWWKKAGEWARQEADRRKAADTARKAEAERERREREDGRRHSDRLRGVEKVAYKEARTWQRRVESGRRMATTAQHGARVGVRVWWWLEEGEGWDASGPRSVRRGRSTEVRDAVRDDG